MKRKMLFSALVLIIAAGVFVWSCSKEEVIKNAKDSIENNSTATLIELPDNLDKALPNSTGNLYFELRTQVGHLISDCGGACRTVDDMPYHLDCTGFGNICNVTFVLEMPSSPKPYTSVYNFVQSTKIPVEAIGIYEDELTNDSTFLFPDRSFLVGIDELNKEQLWLNIPGQVLKRNKEKRFVYCGVFYSEKQVYENF